MHILKPHQDRRALAVPRASKAAGPTDLGVSAIDDTSVRVELEHPAPFVLQILSQPIAAPTHIRAKSTTANSGSADKIVVSNGAYTLVNRVPGSFIELARNSKYWDASNVRIERVRYINAESEATEIREYVAGQIDMTSTIPAPDLERITQSHASEIQTAPILGTLYLALDVTESPFRNNLDLRQRYPWLIEIDFTMPVGVTPAIRLFRTVSVGATGYELLESIATSLCAKLARSDTQKKLFTNSVINSGGFSES